MSGSTPISPPAVETMTQSLRHRGPDDAGLVADDTAALGFRRLSIVDRLTGHQPLANEDGSLHLICNGEIFNHKELRDDLIARGHVFRSRSDVEVLLHLYEEMGDACLGKVNGQFAFVLYDSQRRRLFIARDQFGVAPFFYTTLNGVFIFGSEIKAILAHPGVERRVDLTGLDQILSLPGLVSPRTMFEGILSLPPGHRLVVDAAGPRGGPYWDLDFPPRNTNYGARSEGSYAEEIEHLLTASVRRRLMADVPVGAYLSGGLDSSLLAGIMQADSRDPVRTFSIIFGDRAICERDYQRLVAQSLQCRHSEIELNDADIADRLLHVIWHAECPLKESYDTAALALSASARRHGVPVVLSGEGADELFAGYVGYRYDAFRRQRGVVPPLAPREAELRQSLWGDETIFYEKPLAPLEAMKRALYAEALRPAHEAFDFTRHSLVDRRKLAGIDPLHQRSYLDMKLRLGDHLLGDHGDRMLLAHGVEGRFPFLDIDIAEFACRLPPDLKLKAYQEKYILKRIARSRLPQAIVEREKYAFNAPGSPALLRLRADWIEDLLSPATIRRQGYFDPVAVAALRERYGHPDFSLSVTNEDDVLLAVLTFGLFLETFDMPNLN